MEESGPLSWTNRDVNQVGRLPVRPDRLATGAKTSRPP